MPVSRMAGIKDKIINVPIPLEKIKQNVESLPRTFEEASVIPIMIKRKKEYVSNVFHHYVRPAMIKKAISFLADIYPFYEPIQFDLKKADDLERMCIDEIEEDLDYSTYLNKPVDEFLIEEIRLESEDLAEQEYQDKDAVKKNQTEVSESYFLLPENLPGEISYKSKVNKSHSMVFAPGEGQIPANILREKHPFVLHFPILFPNGKWGLHDEERGIKITPQQFILQRILNLNPVFAQNKPFIFSAVYYIERYQLESKVNISYMRGKMKSDGKGKEFLQMDDGFSVFDNIRGSPRYWQKLRFDMIAKLEQLGPFQFFYTLSCADKRWDENIATLILKYCPDMKVLHYLEELGEDEQLLDTAQVDDGYNSDEEAIVDNEENVELVNEDRQREETNTQSDYWVHQKTNNTDVDLGLICLMHHYDDGFICKRYNLKDFDESKRKKLLSENVLDITRNFDHRVKCFRKNIMYAPQSKLKLTDHQDRTEFQARGNAHIHGAAWSNFKDLEYLYPGLKMTFLKLKERKQLSCKDVKSLISFLQETITCTLSVERLMKFGLSKKRAEFICKVVQEVNLHHHTKTCRKFNTICRFKYPRYPSNFHIIAQEPSNKMSEEEKDSFWKKINHPLEKVKALLELITEENDMFKNQLDLLLVEALQNICLNNETNEIIIQDGQNNICYKASEVFQFYKEYTDIDIPQYCTSPDVLRRAVYHFCLSFCEYGTRVVLQRNVNEIFVNNYNPHWMEAWQGNMDIQLCLDYFSIITYMTDYVTKPETKTTEVLKHVHKEKMKEGCSTKELMNTLIHAYLTHREMGECESYYKLDPTLHFKSSSRKTVFVGTGFPENRSKFLRKVNKDTENERAFDVLDHDGKFLEMDSHHDKYSMRPSVIERICMTQFVMWYDLLGDNEKKKLKKKLADIKEFGYIGLTGDASKKIVASQDDLDSPPLNNPNMIMPEFILLANGKIMRRRSFQAVIRMHKFKEKVNPHEYFYSELLLFRPWSNESELGAESIERCKNLYGECDETLTLNESEVFTKIDLVKRGLFPHQVDVEEGREMVEKYEFDKNEDTGMEVDPDGEQQLQEAEELGIEDATEYLGLHPEELVDDSDIAETPFPEKVYHINTVMDMDTLLQETRQLCPEQRVVLNIIISFCKNLKKSNSSLSVSSPKAPLLVVHGGAGTGKSTLINVLSQWIHKILQLPGEDYDCPYVIRAAPTGMAASNIEGSTLHSAIKLNFGTNYTPLGDKNREILRNRFKNVQVLIIDEFSMVKSDQLYQIHQRLCEIKQSYLPFAGVSVILFGDLMQLKPIKGSYIFEKPKNEKYKQIYEMLPLWEMFDTVELEENHRQGDDKEYANLLNRLRFKTRNEELLPEDLKLLNSRVVPPGNEEEEVIKIFGKNESVNTENAKQLAKIKNPLHKIDAIHIPKRNSIKINRDGTIEDTAFMNQLHLKEGARVILIHNINTSDGLTNGAQGTLIRILSTLGKARYLLIKFDNQNIGRGQRDRLKFITAKFEESGLTPIEKVNFSYTLGNVSKNHAARASVLQFPLKLCWAITSHRVSIFNYILSHLTFFLFSSVKVKRLQHQRKSMQILTKLFKQPCVMSS